MSDPALAPPGPSGYVAGESLRTAYYETGVGEPLLLINGGPGFPARHFGPVADELALILGRRIIRYDQRGTGRSELKDVSAETLKIDLMVDDIEVLRKGLGLTDWAVMGHSFGGVLAMMYAIRYPGRVNRLILSAPSGIDLSFIEPLNVAILSRLSKAQQAELRAISERPAPLTYDDQMEALTIVLGTYLSDCSRLPDLLDLVVRSRIYVPQVKELVWQDLMNANIDLAPSLARLQVPTCLIQGSDDPLGERNVRKVRDAIPGANLTMVPNASHFAWIDNPNGYFSAVRACFDS